MSVKIFILCACFGVVFAKDNNRGKIVDLMTAINGDIKFVIRQSFRVTQMYTNVNQILGIKMSKVNRLESSLLASIDQIKALMKAEKMDESGLLNGSNFIKKIGGRVAKCFQSLLERGSYNIEISTTYFSRSAENLESMKLNVKNQYPDVVTHAGLHETNNNRLRIMTDLETFVNSHLNSIESLTHDFDNTPIYAKCLADNSIVQTIKSLDAFCTGVRSIFDNKFAGGVGDEMNSAMEKLFNEFNDNVGNLENEIKTWDPVKGPFRQALPNYYYRTT